MTTDLNKDTFKEKVFNYETEREWKFEGDKPAIVDFWAEWCGPCKMVGPVLEEIGKDFEGKVDIYKVDVDSNPELSQTFQIQSVPAILFIPLDGQPQMSLGALPKATIETAIKDLLKVE